MPSNTGHSFTTLDIGNVDHLVRTTIQKDWLQSVYMVVKILAMTLLIIVLVKQYRMENDLEEAKLSSNIVRRMKREVNPVFPDSKAVRVVFHSRQLHVSTNGDLGPLFLSKDGKEFGFSKKWNQNMLLANNKNAVQIQEAGLYFIIAQVKYEASDDNTDPVGFKIHARKLRRNASSRGPLVLAECIRPGLKRFEVVSCNTSVMAELENGDEISIFHVSPRQITVDVDAASSYLNIVSV